MDLLFSLRYSLAKNKTLLRIRGGVCKVASCFFFWGGGEDEQRGKSCLFEELLYFCG